jgi:hypothetical protein
MKLKALHQEVEKRLKQKLNIFSSLSIMNVPKQKLLDKGDLVMLLDENSDVVSTEWLKDGHYHVEIPTPIDKNELEEILQHDGIRVFETKKFDAIMDLDRVIDYMRLIPSTKKKLKKYIALTEQKFEQRYSKFGNKADKQTWLQAITKQNGIFTLWCKENGYETATTEAINEAYKIGDRTNDWSLKRRAAMAKCFNKIKIRRDNK